MLLVPYAAQINDGACLPACAQMVLAYYGRKVSQTQLMRLLGTTDAGTPFTRLHLLSQFGVTVPFVQTVRLQTCRLGYLRLLACIVAGFPATASTANMLWLLQVLIPKAS